MSYRKITAKSSKILMREMRDQKRRTNYIAKLKENPRDELFDLIGADNKLKATVDKKGRNQYLILSNLLIQEIEYIGNYAEQVDSDHPIARFHLDDASILSAKKLSDILRYWVFVQTYTGQAAGDDVCQLAIDNLIAIANALNTARDTLENCKAGPTASPSPGGGIAQVLGADNPPGDTTSPTGTDCSGPESDVKALEHDLEVAIFNLPNACPEA